MHRGPRVSSMPPLFPQLWTMVREGPGTGEGIAPSPTHGSHIWSASTRRAGVGHLGRGEPVAQSGRASWRRWSQRGHQGHSRRAARCAHHTRAASDRPPPAPMPAGPRSPPWMPAWEGEGKRGSCRGLLGARPTAHRLSCKASPEQLTQQQPGSPGPASSLASGVCHPWGWL